MPALSPELMRTDAEWTKQWRDPMQLLRMQVAASEVYLAAISTGVVVYPTRTEQLKFEKALAKVDRERLRWA